MEFDTQTSLGPITERDVEEYERAIQAQLPKDYCDYLLSYNGAIPEKTDYWMPEENDWIESIDEMSGIGLKDDPRSLIHYFGDSYIPQGWIPIAHSGYGDYTIISVRPEDYGHIYYLFHETYDPSESESTEGIYHLAVSFTLWMNSLDILAERD